MKYRGSGPDFGMADLIQMGANVATGKDRRPVVPASVSQRTVTCPLGPRVRTFVGRRDNIRPSNPGLLPDARDSAEKLISLFGAKTISPHGLVALVGAHSTSQQRFFDRKRALDPQVRRGRQTYLLWINKKQDSTPGVWDTLFYAQTTENKPKRIVKFPSDINLSKHPKTKSEWNAFSAPGVYFFYGYVHLLMSCKEVNSTGMTTLLANTCACHCWA